MNVSLAYFKTVNVFGFGLQSIWGSDFAASPSEGMSPLQQLLQEQKKHQQKDTW